MASTPDLSPPRMTARLAVPSDEPRSAALPRFAVPRDRRAARTIHARLRRLILDGRMEPGTVLSQLSLARHLGISRTPVREAMRALEEEGLVVSEVNQRARVRGFDAAELDTLYARRILTEALGVRLSVGHLGASELAALAAACAAMAKAGARNDIARWQAAHKRFHAGLVAHGGGALARTAGRYAERSERYLYLTMRRMKTGWWQRGDLEHEEILAACRSGEAARAVHLVVRHLAATAVYLSGQLAPERAPVAVRAVLDMLGAGPATPALRLAAE